MILDFPTKVISTKGNCMLLASGLHVKMKSIRIQMWYRSVQLKSYLDGLTIPNTSYSSIKLMFPPIFLTF